MGRRLCFPCAPAARRERVIRAWLARPQPEGVPGSRVEGENAASRDAGLCLPRAYGTTRAQQSYSRHL